MSRSVWALALAVLVAAGALPADAQQGSEKLVVLIVGKPGSGKTTQARKISKQYRIPSYSMAEILTKELGWVKTRFKKDMGVLVVSGDLVNDETANQLVTKYISQKKAANGFILDGYPTTSVQAAYLKAELLTLGLPPPVVIHLELPEPVAEQRMLRRKRKDDTPENIRRRLGEYRVEEERLLSVLDPAWVHNVDGTPSEQEVWRAVQSALKTAGY